MTNPTNAGAILPFYTETSGALSHARQVTYHNEGWKLLASNTNLIPFIIWQTGAPEAVSKFQAINLNTGKVTDLSTGLIDRRRRNDNTKSWYLFDGSDIGTVLDCGLYKLRLELTITSFISEEIEVVNAYGPESITINPTGCAAGVLSLQATDTVASTMDYERTEYRLSNADAWTTLTPTGSGPYTYDIDIGSITLPAGENVLIRRTIVTTAGNTLQTLHTLTYTNADPCGTYQLLKIDDRSKYANNLWYLELSDSVKWEDKIYESGFVERVYFRSHWDFPEVEREVELLTDNNGNRVLNTADTREFWRIDFERVPNHLLYILSAIGDYSSIDLVDNNRGYTVFSLPGSETEFTFEPDAGGYYARGSLRFRKNKHFETTCTTGETTVAI